MELKDALSYYQMPTEAYQLIGNHLPLGIAGPTGAGKGTMAQYLTQTGKYAPVVSDTTRAPRRNGHGYEVNGVQYWFLSEQQAIQKLANQAYIEAKLVHGNTLYGTSIAAYQDVIKSGRTPILEIDVQGIEELMSIVPTFEVIFLLPPDFTTWEQRLDGRGDMSLDQRLRRFKTAIQEYEVLFNNSKFNPVVNTEVVETAEVIRRGDYKAKIYRQQAYEVAKNLLKSTQAFVNQRQT